MRIGIADTTFARINMGEAALQALQQKEVSSYGFKIKTERYTVPGFKDLPVAAKRLFEDYKCDIVLALGWVGKEDIDEVCAHEANLLLMQVEKEAVDNFKLQKKIALDRVQKHVLNALALLKGKEELTPLAGKGLRQGYD